MAANDLSYSYEFLQTTSKTATQEDDPIFIGGTTVVEVYGANGSVRILPLEVVAKDVTGDLRKYKYELTANPEKVNCAVDYLVLQLNKYFEETTVDADGIIHCFIGSDNIEYGERVISDITSTPIPIAHLLATINTLGKALEVIFNTNDGSSRCLVNASSNRGGFSIYTDSDSIYVNTPTKKNVDICTLVDEIIEYKLRIYSNRPTEETNIATVDIYAKLDETNEWTQIAVSSFTVTTDFAFVDVAVAPNVSARLVEEV